MTPLTKRNNFCKNMQLKNPLSLMMITSIIQKVIVNKNIWWAESKSHHLCVYNRLLFFFIVLGVLGLVLKQGYGLLLAFTIVEFLFRTETDFLSSLREWQFDNEEDLSRVCLFIFFKLLLLLQPSCSRSLLLSDPSISPDSNKWAVDFFFLLNLKIGFLSIFSSLGFLYASWYSV